LDASNGEREARLAQVKGQKAKGKRQKAKAKSKVRIGVNVTADGVRVADACDHAEHTAQPEIGAAIQLARLPSTRSGWVEVPLAF
jgi:hypothetical protein